MLSVYTYVCIVTSRLIAMERVDKHVSTEIDSWKQKRRYGIDRRFRGNGYAM
jgi:hypothetical protein